MTPREVIVTEAEILSTYYPYWCEQMCRVGREDMISVEGCIEDFVVVHWAQELPDPPASSPAPIPRGDDK